MSKTSKSKTSKTSNTTTTDTTTTTVAAASPDAAQALSATSPDVDLFERTRAAILARAGELGTDARAILAASGKFAFTIDAARAILDYAINPVQFAHMKQKPLKRAIQMLKALRAGEYRNIDCTTALALLTLRAMGGRADYSTLMYAASSLVRDGRDPASIPNLRAIRKLVGAMVGRTTAPTQVSRTFGAGGFGQLLGLTTAPAGEVNRTVELLPCNAVNVRFFSLIDRATDAQLDEIAGTTE